MERRMWARIIASVERDKMKEPPVSRWLLFYFTISTNSTLPFLTCVPPSSVSDVSPSSHLVGHQGDVWVGAGSGRSNVLMSNDAVQFHAALLASQIRLLRGRADARIRVSSKEYGDRHVDRHEVHVDDSSQTNDGEWRVIWDTGTARRLREMRQASLPAETGGIVLGHIDQKLKSIYVVSAAPAPLDSEASETGFTRGTADYRGDAERCRRSHGEHCWLCR